MCYLEKGRIDRSTIVSKDKTINNILEKDDLEFLTGEITLPKGE